MKPSYKVLIGGADGPLVCVVDSLQIEQAVQFALNLHQSSNVKHRVFVFQVGDDLSAPTILFESH